MQAHWIYRPVLPCASVEAVGHDIPTLVLGRSRLCVQGLSPWALSAVYAGFEQAVCCGRLKLLLQGLQAELEHLQW